ncbi:MAG: hypothetical protein ABIE07_08140 [Candidatus Zixiibacteriota bacterium]
MKDTDITLKSTAAKDPVACAQLCCSKAGVQYPASLQQQNISISLPSEIQGIGVEELRNQLILVDQLFKRKQLDSVRFVLSDEIIKARKIENQLNKSIALACLANQLSRAGRRQRASDILSESVKALMQGARRPSPWSSMFRDVYDRTLEPQHFESIVKGYVLTHEFDRALLLAASMDSQIPESALDDESPVLPSSMKFHTSNNKAMMEISLELARYNHFYRAISIINEMNMGRDQLLALAIVASRYSEAYKNSQDFDKTLLHQMTATATAIPDMSQIPVKQSTVN